MKFKLWEKKTKPLKFQFDFEKTYLCDIDAWGRPLAHPEVIVPQFLYNEFDGQMAHSIFSQLDTILLHTKLVKTGILCGHNCGMIGNRSADPFSDLVWRTDREGRVRSVGHLTSYNRFDVTGKLAKLIKSETELLKQLIKHRQNLMEDYGRYTKHMRKNFTGKVRKDLLAESEKLLDNTDKYRGLLQKEIDLRDRLLVKLSCPSKLLRKEHKALLADMMTVLRQFVIDILGRGEISFGCGHTDTSRVYKKCKVCWPEDPNKISLISFTEVPDPRVGRED